MERRDAVPAVGVASVVGVRRRHEPRVAERLEPLEHLESGGDVPGAVVDARKNVQVKVDESLGCGPAHDEVRSGAKVDRGIRNHIIPDMGGERRKVMILDDNIISLMIAEDLLVSHGYDVVKMSAPHGCMAKLDYEMPDVLLVDVAMPRLAADDLLDAIRGAPEHEELIIVLYSDMGAERLEKICHAKDVNGYFCKSMDITKLPEFVDRFF
jgi:CheY-like chemotaxis protein